MDTTEAIVGSLQQLWYSLAADAQALAHLLLYMYKHKTYIS